MTKAVRIENACTSSFVVVVETWNKSFEDGKPDTLESKQVLRNPADMTPAGTYLTSHRYLVVRELAPGEVV